MSVEDPPNGRLGPLAAFTFALLCSTGSAFAELRVVPAGEVGAAAVTDLSLNGDVAVTGRGLASGRLPATGAVEVSRVVGGTLQGQQRISAPDGAMWDRFGSAVSHDGDLLVVGAPGDDGTAGNAGSAYVYRAASGTYDFVTRLVSPRPERGARFGCDVATDGFTIAVSACREDRAGADRGAVYLFRESGGEWQLNAIVTSAAVSAGARFGQSLDLSGNLLVVGAPLDSSAIRAGGSVEVFELNGKFSRSRRYEPSGEAWFARFGQSVAIDAGVIAIGAPGDSACERNAGSVTAIAGDVTRFIVADDCEVGDRFGERVTVADGVIYAGAPFDDDAGQNTGAIYGVHLPHAQPFTKWTPPAGSESGLQVGMSLASQPGLAELPQLVVGSVAFNGDAFFGTPPILAMSLTCASGTADCDMVPNNGCETNLSSSAANCGSCGNACYFPNTIERCALSTCFFDSCETNWGNCNGQQTDGCETSLVANPSHCGGCGLVCQQGQTCTGGACVGTPPNCGDGAIDSGEDCDDGNTTSGDGCSSTCIFELSNGMFVVSEVFAVPDSSGSPEGEWYEVYNRSGANLSLRNIGISDEESIRGPEDILRFPGDEIWRAGEYLVIAQRADTFCELYDGLLPDFEVIDTDPNVPNMWSETILTTGSVDLADSGDEFGVGYVRYDTGVPTDAMNFGTSTYLYSPSVPAPATGFAMYRLDPTVWIPAASAWSTTAAATPGTGPWGPICGDGFLDGSENCDDGNTTAGDGCDATCQPEGGGYSQLMISEVLYDAPSGQPEPGAEWTEIYNGSHYFLHIGDYKIGDEETQNGTEGMQEFPDDTVIAPGQIFVIARDAETFEGIWGFKPDFEIDSSDATVPDMTHYSGWASGQVALGNSGDEILLLDDQDLPVDAMSYGNKTTFYNPSVADAPAGNSLYRTDLSQYIDDASAWAATTSPTPGFPPGGGFTCGDGIQTPPESCDDGNTINGDGCSDTCQIEASGLVVSEVYYDAPIGDPDPGSEFIEIYNASGATIDLSVVKLGDEETSGSGEGMSVFPAGATIGAGAFVVVANNATDFNSSFGSLPDYEYNNTNGAVPDMVDYPTWASGFTQLANGGDEVIILGAADTILDGMSYGTSTVIYSPAVGGVNPGESLYRLDLNVYVNNATGWGVLSTPTPGVY